jgi:hypothetical protein
LHVSQCRRHTPLTDVTSHLAVSNGGNPRTEVPLAQRVERGDSWLRGGLHEQDRSPHIDTTAFYDVRGLRWLWYWVFARTLLPSLLAPRSTEQPRACRGAHPGGSLHSLTTPTRRCWKVTMATACCCCCRGIRHIRRYPGKFGWQMVLNASEHRLSAGTHTHAHTHTHTHTQRPYTHTHTHTHGWSRGCEATTQIKLGSTQICAQQDIVCQQERSCDASSNSVSKGARIYQVEC